MLEKPESLKVEGLGSVRSSKGRRLTHIKPGFYQPPKGTIFMASLAFAFLLSLLGLGLQTLREHLLRLWCHRRGERYRRVEIPLYRLREALSFLWLSFPPRIPLIHFSG